MANYAKGPDWLGWPDQINRGDQINRNDHIEMDGMGVTRLTERDSGRTVKREKLPISSFGQWMSLTQYDKMQEMVAHLKNPPPTQRKPFQLYGHEHSDGLRLTTG